MFASRTTHGGQVLTAIFIGQYSYADERMLSRIMQGASPFASPGTVVLLYLPPTLSI